jgi:ribonuclease HI
MESMKPPPTVAEEIADNAGQMQKEDKECLRILQWNADALSTKTIELEERMKKLDVDVAVIQETKFKEKDASPRIPGFKVAMRADREVVEGGGLISYIRDTLPFEKLYDKATSATETSSFRVRLSNNNWVPITNMYVPPANSKGQYIKFAPEIIPCFESSIICGDLNGHSPLWDDIQPSDDRGEEIENWVIEKELSILNSGEPTRHSRITGNGSSPDLSLCGKKWEGKCSWSVEECIGASDHLPIVITLNTAVQHQSISGRTPRWRSNGVDWLKFGEAVEEKISEMEGPTPDLTKRLRRLEELMTDMGKAHVGKVKPGKRTKPWMTPAVRTAVKKRNKLRRDIGDKQRRKEWLEACKEARETIRQAKEESWREVVEEAATSMDERKMWGFIKKLNGSPDNNSPNEVMKYKGKIISSNRRKADTFLSHYANVSRHKFTREERTANRRLKKLLQSGSVGDESCKDLTMKELKAAIKKMKPKSAPGPDDLPPTFFKALGPLALQELLDIYNASFVAGFCPQTWRNATILPLLKSGKPPSDIASFRPVSLTSCAVKILERIIANRLYKMAEEQGWFSHLQAGFRKGRSCEDQVLRIVQAIENGFQQKKLERSVMVLLDYSKAYDMVWREKLLLCMVDKGVPMQFVRWLYGFLQNRQARVRFGDAMSGSKTMKQGLPQGAVLSPILFLFYINNLAEILPESVIISMFADDVAIVGTDRDRKKAEQKVQEAVSIVEAWSKEYKLKLNSDKSECCYFTTWPKEAAWRPCVKIGGKEIPFKANPRLLGVLLDRQLTFGPQTESVTREATSKLRMLASLAHSEYGWNRNHLEVIYSTFVRSKLDYAAGSWQPWLSATNVHKLDIVQNKGMRIISGQYKATPIESLRAEMHMPGYQTLIDRACLVSMEKAFRLPTDHPRRMALDGAMSSKNSRESWFSRGKLLSQRHLPERFNNRIPINISRKTPWKENSRIDIHDVLEGVAGRNDSNEVIRRAALARIEEVSPDITVYTDGSASGGIRDGGSAAVITRGPGENPLPMHIIRSKGAEETSSYEEELQAMEDAVQWIAEECGEESLVMICTDSQSLCKAMLNPDELVELGDLLDRCKARLVIQWVPGHSDVPGNEIADKEAKAATQLEGDPRPISFQAVKQFIKNNLKQSEDETMKFEDHERSTKVYKNMSRKRDQSLVTRAEQVYVARLRSGKHRGFRSYQHLLDPTIDPACPRCESGDEDNLEHWIECAGTAAARMRNFGKMEVELGILTEDARSSMVLARSTLRGADRRAATDRL